MDAALDALFANPLALMFLIAALGFPLGRLRIRGSSLGIAAVLFVGIAIGAVFPKAHVPELLYELGLVLFVYTLGLANGPVFFRAFKGKGLRDSFLVVAVILAVAAGTYAVGRVWGIRPMIVTGLFTGTLTNTPSLAAAMQMAKENGQGAADVVADLIVGYSVAYPAAVLAMMLAILIAERLTRTNYAEDASRLRELGSSEPRLMSRTVVVTRPEALAAPLGQLEDQHGWRVVFGRHKRGAETKVADEKMCVALGDLISIIGERDDVERATAFLGEPSETVLELDRSHVDSWGIFVSRRRVAGQRLRDLKLPDHLGAVITRIRRGDVELVPEGDTVLELGDRVRVLAPRASRDAVAAFFGNSYRALGEVDVMSLGLGIAAGLALGSIPLWSWGLRIKLGLAGGPLVVGLVLGAIRRTGRTVWTLPYGASMTLRQLGLVFFLAGVGVRAGHAFTDTFHSAGGWSLLAASFGLALGAGLLLLLVGRFVLKVPMAVLTGTLGGMQTQPAVLGFAQDRAKSDLPGVGYAIVYPVATLTKIVLAQLLVAAAL